MPRKLRTVFESQDDRNRCIEGLARELGSSVLAKAVFDNFVYMLKVRTGEKIVFSCIELMDSPLWVHLCEAKFDNGTFDDPPHFDRGIDVRLSDIVWVIDAPFGS